MKLVVAMIQPHKLTDVKQALLPRFTIKIMEILITKCLERVIINS